MSQFFAMASRDELWSRGALLETRVSHGQAVQSGKEIVATDRLEDRSLRDACDQAGARLANDVAELTDARVRVVTTATPGQARAPVLHTTITVTIADVSIVTTPKHLRSDYDALLHLLAPATTHPPSRPLPIVWRGGSGAVLLHEAAGHAAEHHHEPLGWPQWLRVRDESPEGAADLLAGEEPRAMRRQSFRDVPMPRMTSVVVEQIHAPAEMPSHRIEVHLVSSGAYEPLTETVTIRASIADLVEDGRRRRLPSFTFRAARQQIARALAGASGNARRYPGVICSREGQELLVGSYAPMLVTAEIG
jgi:hypothetical protein